MKTPCPVCSYSSETNRCPKCQSYKTDYWKTPRWFFDELNKTYKFTIDGAATKSNHLLPRYWTEKQDAFKQEWRKERIFINPPWSDIEPWIGHALYAVEWRKNAGVVFLLPARTGTEWCQELIHKAFDGTPWKGSPEMFFHRPRIAFIDPFNKGRTSPREDSLHVAIGGENFTSPGVHTYKIKRPQDEKETS